MSDLKQVVAEVKMAYNIVDHIESSGISLKRRGLNYIGLCPFHNEKTGSFNVNESYQNYHCFGCGASGDIISFVEKTENLTFIESIQKLAEEKNIELPAFDDKKSNVDYKSIKNCITEAANFFYTEFTKLPPEHVAKKQITDRGLNLKKMLYGYAPEGRQTLYKFLKNKGFSDETIIETGVCRKSEQQNGKMYDFWQGRLMFFITDITGKPIGFSGRKLFEEDKRGKYVNSSDSILFDKSNSLYNIKNAKKTAAEQEKMFIVEGQFDVSAFVEAGITNVVASSGTAFTEKQSRIIKRLITDNGKIVFCFDGDQAGHDAAMKVFKNIPSIHTNSYVVSFPNNQDPCDYRLENGSQKLQEYIQKNQQTMIDFVIENISQKYDLNDTMEKTQYITHVAPIIKTITNLTLREQYIKKIALKTITTVQTIQETVEKTTTKEIEKLFNKQTGENNTEEQQLTINDTKERTNLTNVEEQDRKIQKKVILMIQNNNIYEIAAHLIYLSFYDPKHYIPIINKFSSNLPKIMNHIVKEAYTLYEKSLSSEENFRIIPESFTYNKVVEYILKQEFFPMLNSATMTQQDIKDHFRFLCKLLIKTTDHSKNQKIYSNTVKILAEDKTNNIETLEYALQQEKEQLEKIHQKTN